MPHARKDAGLTPIACATCLLSMEVAPRQAAAIMQMQGCPLPLRPMLQMVVPMLDLKMKLRTTAPGQKLI